MKLTTYEVVGIAGSVALLAVALWLIQVQSTNQTLTGLNNNNNTAVVVGSNSDQTAALSEALVDAGGEDGSVERLVIDDVVEGTGRAVEKGDVVTVRYIGSLTDGTQFDNSYVGGEPLTFKVGAGRVIEGWEQGMLGMQVGGQRTLVVPPELGYGSSRNGPIPPNSTLLFAIELISIE